jgi:diguanylate cyclase (GGDEF)-like protein
MRYLLGFGLLVIVISMLAAVWLAQFIAARINIVVAATSAQNRGELHDATSTGISEVDDALKHLTSVTQRELQTKRSLLDLAVQHQQVHHALSSARKDGLTQLPGRAEFLGLVDALHQRVLGANTSQLVILFVDLDGFKGVNDQHGHAVGDAVLQKTADVLRDQTRGDDVVGRLGGDEFVVCLHAEVERSKQIASDVANRIVESVGAIGFGVGCSIGIATWNSACPDLDSVIKLADTAMYEAKRRGRNRFVYFDGTE